MTKTLKNLIECYQKGELSTPNIQVIDKIFSDEMINLPDDVLLDLTFSRAFFEKSRLTKIRFCNGSFGSSFFKDCFLENCVFSNINFQEMECLKCFFKDCLFMNCIFVDSDISETIFESCTFSKGSLDNRVILLIQNFLILRSQSNSKERCISTIYLIKSISSI